MDSKAILNKIITMLGMEKQPVELGGNANSGGPFFGKLEDGSPVTTDYFDVGHVLMVIKEDGSKVAAPDADHIIYLPVGLAGGSKRYFITTKDGIITSMHLEDNYGATKVQNFASQIENNMENQTKLAVDEVKVDGPKASDEKTYVEKDPLAQVEKEQKMQDDASRLDSLEEQVNQLRVDIAQLFEEMKKGKPEEMKKKEMMSAQTAPKAEKKFTGAPVEENVNLGGLLKSKNHGTFGTVLSKIANSKF
jgi:hypothetical protein